MRRTITFFISIAFIGFWLFLRSPMQLRAPEPIEPVSKTPTITDITLISHDFESFTSVIPQMWRDASNGAFAYADTDYAIVQRAIGAPSYHFVQPSMKNELNLIEENYIENREYNDLTWRIYHGKSPDFAIAYALANGEGWTVYLVLMQVPQENFDFLNDALFLQTLVAFEPTD